MLLELAGSTKLSAELKSKQMKRVVLALALLSFVTLIVFWLGRLNTTSTTNNSRSEQVLDSVAPTSTAAKAQDLADETKTTDALPEQAGMENVEMPDFAAETIRVKYENSEDLPDGIAFSVTLFAVTHLPIIIPSGNATIMDRPRPITNSVVLM